MPPSVDQFLDETLNNWVTLGIHIKTKLNSPLVNKVLKHVSDITLNVYVNDSEAVTNRRNTFRSNPSPLLEELYPTINLTTIAPNTTFIHNNKNTTDVPDEHHGFQPMMVIWPCLYITFAFSLLLFIRWINKDEEHPKRQQTSGQQEARPLQEVPESVQKRKRNDEVKVESVTEGGGVKQSAMLACKKTPVEVPMKNVAYSQVYTDDDNEYIELQDFNITPSTSITNADCKLNLAQADIEVHEQGSKNEKVTKLMKCKSDYHLLDFFNEAHGEDDVKGINEENVDVDEIKVVSEEDPEIFLFKPERVIKPE